MTIIKCWEGVQVGMDTNSPAHANSSHDERLTNTAFITLNLYLLCCPEVLLPAEYDTMYRSEGEEKVGTLRLPRGALWREPLIKLLESNRFISHR